MIPIRRSRLKLIGALILAMLASLCWGLYSALNAPLRPHNLAHLRNASIPPSDVEVTDKEETQKPRVEYNLNLKSGGRLFADEYRDETVTPSCEIFHEFSMKRTHPPQPRLLKIPGLRRELKILKWRVLRYTENMADYISGPLCPYPPELVPFFKRFEKLFMTMEPFVSNPLPTGWWPCVWFQQESAGSCPDSTGVESQWKMTANFTEFRNADVIFVEYPYRFPDNSMKAPFLDLDMFPPRLSGQHWVTSFIGESIGYYPQFAIASYVARFDLLMGTPEPAVDIFIPVYQIPLGSFEQTPLPRRTDYNFTNNTVAWMSSNCGSKIGREIYIEKLMKYIDIDSYGSCLHTKSFPEEINVKHGKAVGTNHFGGDWGSIKREVMAGYKFLLAPENTRCSGYVSEKIYDAYFLGSIPIYWGAPNIDKYVPENSYIDIVNYPDPKDLADLIKKLDSDDKEYSKYFEWKNDISKDGIPKRILDRNQAAITSEPCHIMSRIVFEGE